MTDDPSVPACINPDGHDWCLPSALGFKDPRPVNREGTQVVTYFCRNDCAYQRITETKEGAPRKVYYLTSDFWRN